MRLTIPPKLTQTMIGIALFSLAAALGVGYASGRAAEHSRCERTLQHLRNQMAQLSEENMRIWREQYSDPFRNPPPISPQPASR